ncbi:MAG: citramalate synthase, partial [Kiritimatiellae bacterium]|nr:citramalate synthase [Kiritimatiellia bacterium]
MHVSLYDATLRDGVQGEGISFSERGKIRFVHLLDDLGIDFIEGGFAGSNPRDRHFVAALRNESLTHAQIVAFGLTRRADRTAEADPQLADLLAAETEWVTIYGKCWRLHIEKVLRTTAENNLAMIADSIDYL